MQNLLQLCLLLVNWIAVIPFSTILPLRVIYTYIHYTFIFYYNIEIFLTMWLYQSTTC